MVMTDADPGARTPDATEPAPRPMIEVTPELAERMRDPRLVLALVAIAIGGVALLLGWYGVSGTYDPGEQMSYVVSGGLGGLFLAGVGAALVSSSNMRQATQKIDELQRGMDELASSMAELRAELGRSARPARRTTRKAPTGS
jgi:hypothetical protein